MKDDAQKLLGFLVATVAVGLLIAVFGTRLLGLAAGPENELITTLKRLEQPGAVYAAGLVAERASYQRLSVSVAPDGETAVVQGTLDFVGRFADATTVSSLGFEKVRFLKKNDEWTMPDGPAPRLTGIVLALERRRRALEAGQIPPADGLDVAEADRVRRIEGRALQVDAWFIRSEKDGVEVSEDSRLQGRLPDRPVDERRTRRLSLEEDSRGEFLFPHGLL